MISTRLRGRIERDLVKQGLRVGGVDEVGRGCLAGPVYAAFAVPDFKRLSRLDRKHRVLIRDSKTLSPAQRRKIIPVLEDVCLDWSIAAATVPEIEALGIQQACFLAMRRALAAKKLSFDILLVDGKIQLAGYDGEQRSVIKGDNLCYAIAAASILAKEARDEYMKAQSELYPVYGFDAHVGYSTRHHMDMIRAHGVCPLHRRNFGPVRQVVSEPMPEQPSLFGGL